MGKREGAFIFGLTVAASGTQTVIIKSYLKGADWHLIAHDKVELLESKAPFRVAQLPIVRDTEEILFRHVQLRLEWLQHK